MKKTLANLSMVFLIALFNNCSLQGVPDAQNSNSSVAPIPIPDPPVSGPILDGQPSFGGDFKDVIGAPINVTYQSEIQILGFNGTHVASILGGAAEISLDGIAWSTQISVSSGATIFARMTSGGIDETKTAVVTVGSVSADWAVSTTPSVKYYEAGGVHEHTTIPAGRYLRVECWGGGGGGGGYSKVEIPRALLPARVPVTIGAGGPGANGSFANGSAGLPSSFGAFLSAGGGGGGMASSSGGANGVGGIGVTLAGESGVGGNGGKGGGVLGGSGGLVAATLMISNGKSPGGGGAGSQGSGGGGNAGNGAGVAGSGGAGRCITEIVP